MFFADYKDKAEMAVIHLADLLLKNKVFPHFSLYDFWFYGMITIIR